MKTIKLLFILLIAAPLLFSFNGGSSDQESYPEMVAVTGGSFTMGDEWGVGNIDEVPIHSVTLKSFSIAKTETTVAQWRIFCKEVGRPMPGAPEWGWHDDDPIVNINWDDAVDYCDWLTDKTGHIYRLPTEAEYEYAARGGNLSKGRKYSGSQSLDGSGWSVENADGHPHAVGTKKPNELGLYDMSGNVFEWCNDWYDPEYYKTTPASNPKGPASGTHRVLRGGGWFTIDSRCRVASRYSDDPTLRLDDGGFRVVSTD